MDDKKGSTLPPSASINALHHFLMVAAVAQTYLSSIAVLISSTAVLVINGFDPSNLEFDPPPQKKVAEVAVKGMQRPRDLQQSQNDFFSFEQVQNGFGAVSSCTILLLDIDLTGDR